MNQDNNLDNLKESENDNSQRNFLNKKFWYLLILILVFLGTVLGIYFYYQANLEKLRMKKEMSEVKAGLNIDMNKRIENPETEDLQIMINDILKDRNF